MCGVATFQVRADAIALTLEYDIDAAIAHGNTSNGDVIDADGSMGRSMRTSPRQPSISMPRHACSSMKAEPAAQACGRQATG